MIKETRRGRVGLYYSALLCRLLPTTPGAMRRLVTVPSTTVLGELLEGYLVELTVRVLVRHRRARALCWWRYWRLCHGILLQKRSQSSEKYSFIRTSQCDLDLPVFQHDVTIDACWSLWQCHRGHYWLCLLKWGRLRLDRCYGLHRLSD